MIHMGTSDSIVSLICFSLDANAFPVHILNLIDIIKFNVFIFPLLTTTLFVFLLHFFFFSFRPPCAHTHTHYIIKKIEKKLLRCHLVDAIGAIRVACTDSSNMRQ